MDQSQQPSQVKGEKNAEKRRSRGERKKKIAKSPSQGNTEDLSTTVKKDGLPRKVTRTNEENTEERNGSKFFRKNSEGRFKEFGTAAFYQDDEGDEYNQIISTREMEQIAEDFKKTKNQKLSRNLSNYSFQNQGRDSKGIPNNEHRGKGNAGNYSPQIIEKAVVDKNASEKIHTSDNSSCNYETSQNSLYKYSEENYGIDDELLSESSKELLARGDRVLSSVDQTSGDHLEIDLFLGNKSKSHLKNKNLQGGEDKENNFKVSHKIPPADLGGKNVLGTRCPNTKPALRKKDQQAIAQLNDKVQEITKHVMGGAPPPKPEVSPSST